ncbi:hypothetical protein ACXR0O_09125 [Verrucomicrobiota bacterium sgz303538]
MPTMVDQDKFAAGPYVSVWVGQHQSEEEIDEYLFHRFSDEFRFRLNARSLPEISVEAEAVPPAKLIQGFSHYEKFQAEFVEAAERLGIRAAQSIIVFYFLAYSPERLPVAPRLEMTYVGSFWFGTP